MRTFFAIGLLLWPLVSARALEAKRFELHAVASAANEQTREYSMAADGGIPAQTVLLDKTALLDGTAVQTLDLIPAHDGVALYLHVEFTPEGKQRLGEITTRYLHQKLGVVVDGHLLMAPTIQTSIYGGSLTAGKDPHEFPYPNFWRPFLSPATPLSNSSPLPREQP